MKSARRGRAVIAGFLLAWMAAPVPASAAGAQAGAARRKVIIDQDGAGPAGTDTLSTLALLQSPDLEVLGVIVTAGDVWAKAGVQNMLRMMELTGHGKVPVAMGGEYPLINTREETEAWEDQFGEFGYKGAWNPARYRDPDDVPTPAAGATSLKPINEHGAMFLVDTVRKYPNEVSVWVGGPFTTVALALRLDPQIARLAKEMVLMGSGFNVDKGGNHRINGRREFNWWWDPEATRIAMSAPWKKITITPVDISVKTTFGPETKQKIAKSRSLAAQYVTKYSTGQGGGGYMWDEIAAVAFVDPSIITKQDRLYVNVDIDHGASYGQTIFVEAEVPGPDGKGLVPRKMPSWWQVASVQWDLDLPRFYDMFAALMSR